MTQLSPSLFRLDIQWRDAIRRSLNFNQLKVDFHRVTLWKVLRTVNTTEGLPAIHGLEETQLLVLFDQLDLQHVAPWTTVLQTIEPWSKEAAWDLEIRYSLRPLQDLDGEYPYEDLGAIGFEATMADVAAAVEQDVATPLRLPRLLSPLQIPQRGDVGDPDAMDLDESNTVLGSGTYPTTLPMQQDSQLPSTADGLCTTGGNKGQDPGVAKSKICYIDDLLRKGKTAGIKGMPTPEAVCGQDTDKILKWHMGIDPRTPEGKRECIRKVIEGLPKSGHTAKPIHTKVSGIAPAVLQQFDELLEQQQTATLDADVSVSVLLLSMVSRTRLNCYRKMVQ